MNAYGLVPAAVFVLGAAVAAVLEVIGVAPGERKVIARPHLTWWVAATSFAAAASAWSAHNAHAIDRMGLVAAIAIAVVVLVAHSSAAAHLREIDEERGELSAAYLLFAAGCTAVVTGPTIGVLGAGLGLAATASVFLSAPDREGPHGIEAAARTIVSYGLILALLIVAEAMDHLGNGVAAPLWCTVVLLLSGAAPLHGRAVDAAHGSASSAAALVSASGLIVAGVSLLRWVPHWLPPIDASAADGTSYAALPFAAAAALSLVALPLAALAQVRVGRLVSYLAAAQTGVPFVSVAALMFSAARPPTAVEHAATLTAVIIGALGACAALLGVTLATKHPAATWEDWSGFGRTRPVVAAVFVYALATCAGLPGTPGFLARLAVSEVAFSRGVDWLGLLCLASTAFAAAPVVRLTLFLFSKERSAGQRGDGASPPIAFVVLCGACGVLAAFPSLLDVVSRWLSNR